MFTLYVLLYNASVVTHISLRWHQSALSPAHAPFTNVQNCCIGALISTTAWYTYSGIEHWLLLACCISYSRLQLHFDTNISCVCFRQLVLSVLLLVVFVNHLQYQGVNSSKLTMFSKLESRFWFQWEQQCTPPIHGSNHTLFLHKAHYSITSSLLATIPPAPFSGERRGDMVTKT